MIREGGVDGRPAWTVVVRAQIVLLRYSGRPLLLFGIFAVLGVLIHYVSPAVGGGGPLELLVSPAFPAVVAGVGAVWGACVWWDEGPAKRNQHWRMPVDVTRHDLARVTAGALWLIAAILPLLAISILVSVVGKHGSFSSVANVSPTYWISVFVAGLIGYLILAAIATATARVVELVVVGALLFRLVIALLVSMPQSLRVVQFRHYLVTVPIDGKYGLMSALGGMGIWGNAYLRGSPAPWWSPTWLQSALLWTALAALLLAAACLWNRRRWTR
jgi:hypothetical protein